MSMREATVSREAPHASHVCRLGDIDFSSSSPPAADDVDPRNVEPWLSALLQGEHLSMLIGSGFPIGAAALCKGVAASMASKVAIPDEDLDARVQAEAKKSASRTDRGDPNIEDELRVALLLEAGLRIAGKDGAEVVGSAIEMAMEDLIKAVLLGERSILDGESQAASSDGSLTALGTLVSFMLSFASRTPNRDRLHLFTTNYDRLIEHVAEAAGLRLLDRFVGYLEPRFRSSRLEVDMHYNPPGTHGEPRFMEGVVRYSKLHGSLDWRSGAQSEVIRVPVPFGGEHTTLASREVLVYPNSAKDQETAYFPYADLFRDFSAAVCRPNSVVVAYGYGFGDDHINRILADMLTIPSTHLLVVSFDDPGGRVARFEGKHGREGQVSLMLGKHFGDLRVLVGQYLPKPAIDDITWRRASLLRARAVPGADPSAGPGTASDVD